MNPLNSIALNGYNLRGTLPSEIPQPSDEPDKQATYLKYIADDKQFLLALTNGLTVNTGGLPIHVQSIVDSAAANVGNLTPEERAQVIEQAKGALLRAAIGRSNPSEAVGQVIANIERLANNQGYTGPGAGAVVATTPTAAGGANPITRGQLLDNENFGNLVNSVFTAAGGTAPKPATAAMAFFPGKTGTPGDIFNSNGRAAQNGVDITKMSEAERIEFLNQVAAFARDGTISGEEQAHLEQMAANFSRNGDNEPAAVTANNGTGKPTVISKDDLMENSSFEKQLNSMAAQGFPFGIDNNPDTKALRDAIATANYDELGYEERVALVQAFNAATGDHTISAQEADGIAKMLQEFQKPSGAGGAASTGTTLSNGLVVSNSDVEGNGSDFMSMVNTVLDRSGVNTPNTNTTAYGTPTFSDKQYALQMLRGLDVSGLTAEQRIHVLEMISQAGSDREISRDEARAILNEVNQLSPRGDRQTFLV